MCISEGAQHPSTPFRLPSCRIHKACPPRTFLQLLEIQPPKGLCSPISGAPSLTQGWWAAYIHAGQACRGDWGPSVLSSHQPGIVSQRGCPGDGVYHILNRTLGDSRSRTVNETSQGQAGGRAGCAQGHGPGVLIWTSKDGAAFQDLNATVPCLNRFFPLFKISVPRVTLDKSPDLSEPQFPQLVDGREAIPGAGTA